MGRQGNVGLGVFVLLLVLVLSEARRHELALKNDARSVVHLNTFGFYANGTLEVNVSSLTLQEEPSKVGFSFSKSRATGVMSTPAEELKCPQIDSVEPHVQFLIDTDKLRVSVSSVGVQDSVLTDKTQTTHSGSRKRRGSHDPENSPGSPPKEGQNSTPTAGRREEDKRNPEGNKPENKNQKKTKKEKKGDDDKGRSQPGVGTESVKTNTEGKNTTKEDKPRSKDVVKDASQTVQQANGINWTTLQLQENNGSYSFSFQLVIGQLDEGMYNLYFFYCKDSQSTGNKPYTLQVAVTEKNLGGYLSAAEIPLPRLYIVMAGFFFIVFMLWVYTLMKHRYSVFKIHWLMAALAFTKSISLVFHSINYHFINTEGHPIEGWAVMYYITHLLKGALLFITLALIGTGWAFVKYVLSDKEKKIFMIVIPLQVLANVALIILESTEEGTRDYALWREVLFFVDLFCCGAILFPVVWSIRHLQEASNTDGKAAMSLEKLKLFRHYYVMIVCYIYFTRIIAVLMQMTMPFRWQWCHELLVEVSTLIFFVLTGYKFRPASNNPYLQLPQDEEDMEVDEVVTESGALEGISKVNKTSNGRERQRESAL
ncbi:hypothetical protein DPEC_G00169560 [Dallia pectoralis]|uniref:Uncharacterized protein n=1 Tax=Dallia pectoralis TaxID=75939 RepID=A0ACC2GCP0_DALPE|nr:hypothetical protein DPEC_G00169560 [Dallia pectoralis]